MARFDLRRGPAYVRDESGQMAFLLVLSLLVVFLFFALSFDAGVWYFDHRSAQNQSEAAAIAAAGALPSTTTDAAVAAARDWLNRNGVDCDLADGCPAVFVGGQTPTCTSTPCATMHFEDTLFNDGVYDRVTVAVHRPSPGIFASLSSISSVDISASATVLVGPADIANVMPWAVIPPLPDCDQPGEICQWDYNGDGDVNDPEDCNDDFLVCPWGLHPEKIYAFKEGGGGNTNIIDACGSGASNYSDCISGEDVSGFFQAGQSVVVGLQGGSLGQNTDCNLRERYKIEVGSPSNPCTNTYNAWSPDCDVAVSPTNVEGYDPDGVTRARAKLDTPPQGLEYCRERLVLIPILRDLPPQGGGSAQNVVLGVATFGIARWDRASTHGQEAMDPTPSVDTGDGDCTPRQNAHADPTKFDCGMVWGYLLGGTRPPEFLLQRIGGTVPNPLAPLLIALVE